MKPLFARSRWNTGQTSSLALEPIARDRAPVDLYPRIGDERWSDRTFQVVTTCFLVLGVATRLIRYVLLHPLWSDESFVAVNLIQRGYLDLLRPLDYQQVSPWLFLWVELTAVKLLGFSEWSLRLFPTIAGVASLFVFRHVAGRLLKGLPLLFAVAILAVAVNPIRHSGEVKPYAGDFLVSTALLAIVVEWWRRPSRPIWLWALTLATPLAIGLSLPSTFVIGGISVALSASIARSKNSWNSAAYVSFNLVILVSSLLSLKLLGGSQSVATHDYMDYYWSKHFPPFAEPSRLPLWVFQAFTGQLFAYPVGGANGASILTLICCLAGTRDLIHRGRGLVVSALLAPMGLAFAASAFRLYPFGDSERLMQFEGPMICLLAGHGLAWSVGQARRPRSYRRLVLAILTLFATIGVGTIAADIARPGKTTEDLRAREFAREFWVDQARDSVLACASSDLGLDFEGGPTHHGRSADYACLRQIYSPRHRQGLALDWTRISVDRPLRCVIYDGVPADSPLFARWMELMGRSYRLVRTETYRVNAGSAPKGVTYEDHFAVLEFVPRGQPVDPISIARNAASTDFRTRRGTLRLSTSDPNLLP